jgi:hypothetical protein
MLDNNTARRKAFFKNWVNFIGITYLQWKKLLYKFVQDAVAEILAVRKSSNSIGNKQQLHYNVASLV